MRKLLTTSCLLVFMITTTQAQEKAERVQRTASFVVKVPVEKAFPLFGPVREMEWAAGWAPQIIYSVNPEVEEHMMFRTKGRFEGEDNYLWVVTQYRPHDFFIEYSVTTSERCWFISVKCERDSSNTRVTVTYTYTGLTAKGNELNQLALENMYASNLKDWEEAVNYYLRTGKRLE